MAETCFSIDSFGPDEAPRWVVVNDGVMGGLSEGLTRTDDGQLIFEGVINTNGGGFSSLRRQVEPGALAGVESMRLHWSSDGRAYKMTFRTDARRFRRPISYQAAIPPSDGAGVTDIALTDMRTSIFGRTVDAPPFDPAKVEEIGIILADGQDGPFRITLDKIEGCRAEGS